MRLIDADALKEKAVHYSETEYHFDHDAVQMDDIDDAPTIDASPWHRVEEPPKQNGAFAVACVYDGKLYWYKGIYLDGKWLREGDGIEMPADYWMPLPEPPKEDA
ncbi:MAG: hypothetical protein IIZ93_13110 [Acidaminococcaceae bacterium]|nr:hypothetical protein [Acidaminococcaceae bacterium]